MVRKKSIKSKKTVHETHGPPKDSVDNTGHEMNSNSNKPNGEDISKLPDEYSCIKMNSLEDAVNIIYTKMFLKTPNWEKILPPGLYRDVCRFSVSINSRIDLVMGSMLLAVACAIGKHGKAQIRTGHVIPLNLFMLMVGKPLLGKTAALSKVFEVPMMALEQEHGVKLTLQEFTKSGLSKFMESNGMQATYCTDEIGHPLLAMISNKLDEYSGFRAQLNKFWDGMSHRKQLSGSTAPDLTSTCLNVGGMIQPHPVLKLIHRLKLCQDGLLDRFVLFTGSVLQVDDKYEDDNASQTQNVQNNFERANLAMLRKIYILHKDETIKYTLSVEAAACVKEYSDSIMRADVMKFSEIVDQLQNNEATPTKKMKTQTVPSKTTDNAVKLGTLLKIVVDMWQVDGDLTERQRTRMMDIQLSDIQKGFDLMASHRDMMEETINFIDECIPPSESPSSSGLVPSGGSTVDARKEIMKQILILGGKFITASMAMRIPAIRRFGTNIGIRINEAMNALKGDGPRFVGVKVTGKPKSRMHVFYKAHPVKVSQEVLEELGIDRKLYEDQYNSDISSNAPVTGLKDKWPELYKAISDITPEEVKEEQERLGAGNDRKIIIKFC